MSQPTAPAPLASLTGEYASVFDLLHDAPLLPGENPADFAALRAAAFREVNPSTLIEQIFASELASLAWEERRLRRLRDVFIRKEMETALRVIIEQVIEFDEERQEEIETLDSFPGEYARQLARLYWARDTATVADVSQLLAKFNVSMDEIAAKSFSANMRVIHDFDSMIAGTVRHRNRLINDIDDRGDRRRRLSGKMDAIIVEG